MTAPQKAKLAVLENSQVFERKLEQELGELRLLIEWTLQSLQLCSVSSGTEAANYFTERLKEDQYHLHFRAFSETVEYAWFGTIGVYVELTPEGNLEVNEQGYYAKGQEGEDQAAGKARVQQLIQNGHVVYEKLLSVVQEREA